MEKNIRYAEIPVIGSGVAFSDPSYGPDVWCQYRKEFKGTNWVMKLETAKAEDGYIDMTLTLGRRSLLSHLTIEESNGDVYISFPSRFDTHKQEIGIDTAKVFVGSLDNFNQWGEEGSIYTGADGLFGDLRIFTCKGEDNPAGFLLNSAIDGSLTTEDELFRTLLSSFDGRELGRTKYDEITDKDNLSVRLLTSAELSHANAAGYHAHDPSQKGKNR